MTANKDFDKAVLSVGGIIGLMTGIFVLFAIFLPPSFVQPVGAVTIGLVLTIILVVTNRLELSKASTTWLATGILLILVHLIVSRSATVGGQVVDDKGSPMPGLTLILTDSSGVDHKAVTDENGEFEVKDIPEGQFTILADGELLISGKVPSGWKRILDPRVEVGSPVHRPGPTAITAVTPDVPAIATPIPATNTPLPATDTPVSEKVTETTTPESTDTPFPTLTSTPTATPTDTPTLTPTLTKTVGSEPFFLDEFNGSVIDKGKWIYDSNISLFVKDGRLQSPEKQMNCDGWCTQNIRADIGSKQFSMMEMQAVITEGATNGLFAINTSCNDDPSDPDLILELRSDGSIEGKYQLTREEDLISLAWGKKLELEVPYTVRLVQDGEVVRAFVNGEEMRKVYPCTRMGRWLTMGAESSPGGFISGYFEYVRLWTSTP